jgi:quinohemoprotein ethanol dehydrogenase
MTVINKPLLLTLIFITIAGCNITNETLTGVTEGESSEESVFLTESQNNRQAMVEANADANQWNTLGGDFGESHFSPLDQINVDNVAQLGLAWEYDTKTKRGLEATPIVVNGIMYTSGTWGKVYAVDAKTGAEMWFFDPEVNGQVARDACCGPVNRGVAVWNNLVYVTALDGRLFALNAASGQIAWEVDTIDDHSRRYTSTGAPRVAGNVVVIGNSGAEYDARGYVSAYDLKTGALKWRFYTVPGSPEKPYEHAELAMAAKTWDPNSRWDVGGGGTVWDSLVYDPTLNLLYVGTGNSAVYLAKDRSPMGGDNLFLSSILAINPDNGKLVWYYQTTPADSWDFTAVQNMILADIEIDGNQRQVLMQAPKNGYFYVLDRKTGELLSAEHYVPVNWSSHVDMATGKPVLTEQADYYKEPKVIWPAQVGAHGWRPMAYSPQTGLVYIPAYESAELRVNLFPDGYEYIHGRPSTGAVGLPPFEAAVDYFTSVLPYEAETLKKIIRESNTPPPRGVLKAWDPVKQRMIWEVDAGGMRNDGGVLTTAGNLVIYGKASGELVVRDALSGELLHSIDTGTGIMAAPLSYKIDGEQYVAVMAGIGGGGFFSYPRYSAAHTRSNQGRIIAFKLGGGETPVAKAVEKLLVPRPPPKKGNAEVVKRGNELYLWHCMPCHNNAGRGNVPDLRYLGEGKHHLFDSIVREGLFTPMGMPRFDDLLDKSDTDAIQAYLIDQSWKAFAAQGQVASSEQVPDLGGH